MGFHVVTIAMMSGAGAERIGRLAAEQLGFQYVNDEIIDRAAAHAGVSRQEMAEVERSPSLIRRIMTALGATATPSMPARRWRPTRSTRRHRTGG